MKHEYSNLGIWKKARQLNKSIYLRRASVSVVSNIAEGSGYDSDSQFIKFLYISLGSLCELEAQIYVAYDLNFVQGKQLKLVISQSEEIKKMTLGLLKKTEK